MQENCVCEVIGCGNQACWHLVVRQDSSSEGLLCDTHWQLLHLRDPRRASRYTHLSSLLAEGMGLTPGIFTKNPRRDSGFESNPNTSNEKRNDGIYDD